MLVTTAEEMADVLLCDDVDFDDFDECRRALKRAGFTDSKIGIFLEEAMDLAKEEAIFTAPNIERHQ